MFRIFFSFLLILVACAPNKTVYQLPDGYQNFSQQLSTAWHHEGPYTFVRFDLDADFNGIDNTLEVEYSHKGEQVQALYKDKINKVFYAGDLALKELHPILSGLTFTEFSADQAVIEQVIRHFGLPEDASLHLKIEYP